jgi:glycosyltransferase involved in cell wall biosynthesis
MQKFNDNKSVALITSFPAKNGEIARANAISRYSYLLAKSFSKSQKVVVISEAGDVKNKQYQIDDNILVENTYKVDSLSFVADILKKIIKYNEINDILIQFEFSIFGGKKMIPQIILLLFLLKIMGKNVSITMHQVVNSLNDLSGHLGLHRSGVKIKFLNLFLELFNYLVGLFTNKIIVHDDLLKKRLSKYVDENKIVVIPHAIGDQSIRNITKKDELFARKEFGLKRNDKVIAVYGYRSWYKGTDWIVKTVKELSGKNPKLKLLVAGGVSPTLKDTASYKKFDRKLKREIQKANGSVKVTGFIPEKNVWKVFAASDVLVYPYRTRMSASGAFSLGLSYKKPFLVSSHFADGLDFDVKDAIFDLNTFSFESALNNIESKKVLSKLNIYIENYLKNKDWGSIGGLYLTEIKKLQFSLPKINLLPRLMPTA